jgi:regulation of enolase protein 1 (concanavalin A-like superfamily)
MGAFKPIRQELALVIDLDERGWFKAHVENQNGKTVFQFSNEDEETGWPSEAGLWLVEDGFMRHGRDTDGLLTYLKSIGIAKPTATMSLCNY